MQQLTPLQLKARLESPQPKPVILDVREPWELKVCTLPDITHIPMGQIPARVQELDSERDIVVICHHGMRSQQVVYFLAHRGFKNLFNLAGGIDAWARTVDATMAKY